MHWVKMFIYMLKARLGLGNQSSVTRPPTVALGIVTDQISSPDKLLKGCLKMSSLNSHSEVSVGLKGSTFLA